MSRATQEDCAHLPLIDSAFLLSASKHRSYKESVLTTTLAAVDVLSEEGLVKGDVRSRFAQNPEEFRLDIGELTTKGFEFARAEYQRWLSNIDRWKSARTVKNLKASLRKQLVKFRARFATERK